MLISIIKIEKAIQPFTFYVNALHQLVHVYANAFNFFVEAIQKVAALSDCNIVNKDDMPALFYVVAKPTTGYYENSLCLTMKRKLLKLQRFC